MNQNLLHTPEGVRDIYGPEYARKLQIERLLSQTLLLYGYEAVQTPTFEYFDVFSREIGTTPSKELYKFFDKEGNTLVLRPDFTPSIVRCAAKYFTNEDMPVRLCYSGNTFVNTSNLQGKLKEVTELGAEYIGESSVEADAEILNLVIEALLNSGLQQFQVSIGQVDYFKGLCEEAGLSEDTELLLRDYISGKNYYAAEDLLVRTGVAEEVRRLLLSTTELFGGIEEVKKAQEYVKNERALRAIAHLEALYEVLRLYGNEQYVSFDLGMLSKYRYYTGIIFKAYTYGIGDAIAKGGRYDSLMAHFGRQAGAVGFCIVADDLLEALSRQKASIAMKSEKKVLTYRRETFPEVLKQAKQMRAQGQAVVLKKEK